jgi:hypothetical protein
LQLDGGYHKNAMALYQVSSPHLRTTHNLKQLQRFRDLV